MQPISVLEQILSVAKREFDRPFVPPVVSRSIVTSKQYASHRCMVGKARIMTKPSIAAAEQHGGGSCFEMEGGSLEFQSSVAKKQNSLIASIPSGAFETTTAINTARVSINRR